MSAFITATPLALSHNSKFRHAVSTRPVRLAPCRPSAPCMLVDPLTSTTQLLADNPVFLQKIAAAFNSAFESIGVPQVVIEWGHPVLMGIMILAMGLPGAVFGWQGRLNENKKEGVQQKKLHENVMLAFFLLAAFGGTGGTLSVAMQGYDVWQSPHAISAAVVLLLLGANAVLAYSGFTIGTDGTPKGRLQGRKVHAYFGAVTMAVLFIHGAIGLSGLLG